MYIGVGVCWQRRCKTSRSLRELDRQPGYRYFILYTFGGHQDGIELDHIVRGGEL